MTKNSLTLESLRERLHYEPESGELIWKKRPKKDCPLIGARAGCQVKSGYRVLSLDHVTYREHRLIWFWVHGEWPKDQIDHINGIRDDNRLVNLRECTRAENGQNKALCRKNRSGYPGVFWDSNAWRARIGFQKIKHHLGYFKTPEEAYAAYLAAKARMHTFQPTVRHPPSKGLTPAGGDGKCEQEGKL